LFKRGDRATDPTPVRVDVTFGDGRAKRARLAARSNDGDTLHALVAETDDPHEREFLLHASLDGISRAPWIDHLPDRYPDSSAAWAIRGVHTLRSTWKDLGGEGRGAPTDAETQARWQEHLGLADRDLLHATRVGADDDPVPWSYLVATGAGLGLSVKEICDRFDEADQREPWLLMAHHHLVQATSPAGVGSDETMFAVAADVAGRAPEGNACHDLVALAHLDRARREPSTPEQPGMAAYLGRSAVAAEIDRAARRSVESREFDQRPLAVVCRNVFAYAFVASGQLERAQVLFRRIGDRPSELPWGWDDPDPGLAYARARQKAGVVPD
jgi:hypothetical protein